MAAHDAPDRWLVISADIIGSRRVTPRAVLPLAITSALQELNAAWPGAIAVPFALAAGDAVQGVLYPGPDGFAMARRLRWALRQAPLKPPLALRIGIGWGAIETPIQPGRSSWEMDGPAFHLARQALAETARLDHPVTRFRGAESEHAVWVNLVLQLVDTLMGRWTPAQWEAISAYERLGTYRAAATTLGIALQNVQKRCAAAAWPVVREAEITLGRSLNGLPTPRPGTPPDFTPSTVNSGHSPRKR